MAGWLYRAGLEAILGFRLQGEVLLLAPCIPKAWPEFEIVYLYRTARYEIAATDTIRGSTRLVALQWFTDPWRPLAPIPKAS